MKPVDDTDICKGAHDLDMGALLEDGTIKPLEIHSIPLTETTLVVPRRKSLPSIRFMGALFVLVLLMLTMMTDLDLDDVFPFLDSSDDSSDSLSSDSGDSSSLDLPSLLRQPESSENLYEGVLSGMDGP
jgi:hypothetical protein